ILAVSSAQTVTLPKKFPAVGMVKVWKNRAAGVDGLLPMKVPPWPVFVYEIHRALALGSVAHSGIAVMSTLFTVILFDAPALTPLSRVTLPPQDIAEASNASDANLFIQTSDGHATALHAVSL